ncbi:hypothetical protein PsorP6_009836 [Peronosclerospora sorghi]|uniref:Uncharacterized protein n=1 Tax=Peronosclerospora sorghi TaxID=230839 RepID=A0ACC0VZL8_9STRA|nr:hypothetical protein PsorP6_009836 [Peronosclerospora sorghi]
MLTIRSSSLAAGTSGSRYRLQAAQTTNKAWNECGRSQVADRWNRQLLRLEQTAFAKTEYVGVLSSMLVPLFVRKINSVRECVAHNPNHTLSLYFASPLCICVTFASSPFRDRRLDHPH